MIIIKFTENGSEIKECFGVIKELRPALKDEEDFLGKMKNLLKIPNYKIAFLKEDKQVKSVATIRVSDNLAWGKYLYIDDFVTLSTERSKGYGDRLFNWIVNYAKTFSCDQLHLDSGVQRFDAHRFYLKNSMNITSHHFGIKLK